MNHGDREVIRYVGRAIGVMGRLLNSVENVSSEHAQESTGHGSSTYSPARLNLSQASVPRQIAQDFREATCGLSLWAEATTRAVDMIPSRSAYES